MRGTGSTDPPSRGGSEPAKSNALEPVYGRSSPVSSAVPHQVPQQLANPQLRDHQPAAAVHKRGEVLRQLVEVAVAPVRERKHRVVVLELGNTRRCTLAVQDVHCRVVPGTDGGRAV